MMMLGSQRATSVTFVYPRGTGRAPVTKLPRDWYATIRWGDGSKDEVWFCHHAGCRNRDGFAAVSRPWFIKVPGFAAPQNAEEWQAERDALPGGNRKVPVWNPPGSGEGVGSGSLPGWTPARRGGGSGRGVSLRVRRFPTCPPVYVANKAIADILPTTYGCGQMTISGTTWSWNQ